jgi:hypothetical protein
MRQIIQQHCCRTPFDLVSIRTAFSFAKRPLGQNAFSPDHRFLRVSAVSFSLFLDHPITRSRAITRSPDLLRSAIIRVNPR